MKITPADIETIEQAAALLDGEAGALLDAHVLDPESPDWTGEEAAKVAYDEMKKSSADLYKLADRMKAQK